MDILNGDLFVNLLLSASNNLENQKEEINKLNVFPVPDGDTGTNMSLTFSKATKEIALDSSLTVSQIADKLASASLRGARGNSGVILSQYLRGISKGLKDMTTVDVFALIEALNAGTQSAYQAVMKPTEGTILTIMKALSEKALEYKNETIELLQFLKNIIKYGKEVLEKTPDMLPKLKEANVVDAGGVGLITIFEGMIYYLENNEIMPLDEVKPKNAEEGSFAGEYISDITYGYCTEYIIIKQHRGTDFLKRKLEKIGDSVVVVEDNDIIKVHVHTDNPDIAIGLGLKLGQLINLKIDNMRHQNEELRKKEEEKRNRVKTKYGFVAVASGDGFKKIYNDLGINSVIFGGQSMNPSTDDILKKVYEANAETVFIFPNNKNIILAAEQAKKIFDGDLVVIPTTSMAHVFSLMMVYDESLSKKELTKAFKDILSKVTTGQVTYAVRDSKVNSFEIKKDNIIGIVNDKVVSVKESIEEATMDTLSKMVKDDTEVITIYAGSEVSDEMMNELTEKAMEIYPDCDISAFRGEQPIYYFIISAE